jgi:PIN domain
MFVVLDTNSFYGDPMLRGRHFRLLHTEQAKGTLQLVVPEAVRAELPRRYREQLQRAGTRASDALSRLAALDVKTPKLDLADPDVSSEAYRLLLKARLNELGVLVPPLPDISVDALFKLAIDERRPFRAGGKGFKDALIWQAVLSVAKDDDVMLISNDGDFAESEKQPKVLHQHLRQDLMAAGLSSDRVRLFKDLKTFIDEHVPGSALILDRARQQLDTDTEWANALEDQLRMALAQFTPGGLGTAVASRKAQIENVTLSDSRLDALGIDEAYDSDGQQWLDVTVQATMAFEFVTDPLSAEWLATEKADIEIDAVQDTVVYGHTGERTVLITYAIDLDPDTFAPTAAEQVHAEDLDLSTQES